MALAFAPLGREHVIMKITAEEKIKHHLESLGIIAGSKVTCISDHGGSVILKVKEGRLAINKALAMKIFVA